MKLKIALLMAVVSAFLGFTTVDANATEPTVIVMPSRYTVVQFAFDAARLRRNVYLMTYEQLASSKAPVYHVWDEKMQDWVKIELNDYVSGSIFAATPKKVVLIGSDKDIVPELAAAAPTYAPTPERVQSLELVTLMNSFHKVFDFNKREWKWMGDRHKIEFKDLNEDRRKYGKYGKPGSDITMPEAKVTEPEKIPAPVLVTETPQTKSAPDVKVPATKPLPPEDK